MGKSGARGEFPVPVIGLTGVYCAGKNHVARLLEERGLPVLDVDKLGHEALELEKDAVIARFGPGLIGEDGRIDRRALGAKVFGKAAELAALEGIVHPEVNRLTDRWIARCRGPCVINAALLHRSSSFGSLAFIILVEAPWITRLLRARRRDRLPFAEILKRLHSQKQFIPQYLSKNADIYRVYNRGLSGFCSRRRLRSLERRIDTILAREGVR
ncbi:MAG: dephospho-CoA kinase [Spirochaetaceae bacterium]|jgi:dephospho-CoA kinase|nr:dephospho-CoA kinase [Spirochaetaceae bacterium]